MNKSRTSYKIAQVGKVQILFDFRSQKQDQNNNIIGNMHASIQTDFDMQLAS